MKVYIQATGNISAQKTFGHPELLESLAAYTGNRLKCIEPDYKEFIDAKMIRRMSRIIRMGVAASSECLQEAGVKVPDAIITGTAYGCLEDTGLFLGKLVEHHEELLTPTAFIQSTHNTIGAQIALMLNCHNYNNAFVHRAFSFESALLDATMLLQEGETGNVLVGAIDEITDKSYAILSRFGLYRKEPVSNLDLISKPAKGTIAGEGASFFLLSHQSSGKDYGSVDALTTFYKPESIEETAGQIQSFLKDQSISLKDIDLVITGRNGDVKDDEVYDQLQQRIFNDNILIDYKNLCGEYPTAVSFAMWLAANIIKNGKLPVSLDNDKSKEKKIRKILVYNHYQNTHHSLLLISAC